MDGTVILTEIMAAEIEDYRTKGGFSIEDGCRWLRIPGLITTHCMAHRLQLLTEKAANQCPQIIKHIAVVNTFT